MFIPLLDLIGPDGRRPRRILWDTIRPHEPKSLDTIQQPVVTDTVDTLQNGNVVTDSVSQSSLEAMTNNLGTGGGATPSLFWMMLLVVAALAICFYLVFAYRKYLAPHKR